MRGSQAIGRAPRLAPIGTVPGTLRPKGATTTSPASGRRADPACPPTRTRSGSLSFRSAPRGGPRRAFEERPSSFEGGRPSFEIGAGASRSRCEPSRTAPWRCASGAERRVIPRSIAIGPRAPAGSTGSVSGTVAASAPRKKRARQRCSRRPRRISKLPRDPEGSRERRGAAGARLEAKKDARRVDSANLAPSPPETELGEARSARRAARHDARKGSPPCRNSFCSCTRTPRPSPA